MEHTTQLAHTAFQVLTSWVRGHPRHEEGCAFCKFGGSGRQHVKIIYQRHHTDIAHIGTAFKTFFLKWKNRNIFFACLLFEKSALGNNMKCVMNSVMQIQSRLETMCLVWVENYMGEGSVTEPRAPWMEPLASLSTALSEANKYWLIVLPYSVQSLKGGLKTKLSLPGWQVVTEGFQQLCQMGTDSFQGFRLFSVRE